MSEHHTNIDRRDFLTSSAIGAAMAVFAAKVSAAETAHQSSSVERRSDPGQRRRGGQHGVV